MRNDLIKALHLTGPLARASGAGLDTRSDHPYGIYHKLAPQIKFSERGDVLARFEVKKTEDRPFASKYYSSPCLMFIYFYSNILLFIIFLVLSILLLATVNMKISRNFNCNSN